MQKSEEVAGGEENDGWYCGSVALLADQVDLTAEVRHVTVGEGGQAVQPAMFGSDSEVRHISTYIFQSYST